MKGHATTAGDILQKIDPRSDLPAAKRRALADDILHAIGNFQDSTLVTYSDNDYAKARKHFEKFALAMRKVEIVWNGMGDNWLLLDDVDLDTIDKLEDVIAFGHRCAAEALANKTTVINRKARLKRLAVSLAFKLLSDHGVKPTATKGSMYCNVANLIYGGDDDLLKACREHNSAQRATRKAKKTKS